MKGELKLSRELVYRSCLFDNILNNCQRLKALLQEFVVEIYLHIVLNIVKQKELPIP